MGLVGLHYPATLYSLLTSVRKFMLNLECTSTLDLIDQSLGKTLSGIVRGIEKEGLRVTNDGSIAQSRHPQSLGSTLTHPTITTDYSEALLEFITPTHVDIDETVNYLSQLHSFTLRHGSDEVIWPASMPCRLDGDESIPIAWYGTSNIGMLKHVYRQGLGVRYGRIMQSIAGIHYNFSLPSEFWPLYQDKFVHKGGQQQGSVQDFQSAHYFSLIRNFRRYSWILHYLFGASPVLDKSFLDGRAHTLERFNQRSFGLPYATSLRMSDLGYQNSAQEELHVSYSSLDDYVTTLADAMQHRYTPYDEIGVKVNGEYQQLNTNVLQIENEYYSDIRPKRVTQSGEKPIAALRDRGVEYIEVRILDINPFLAEGINAEQIRFLDAFLLYCLFSQCPDQSDTRCTEIRGNQTRVILSGRDPNLQLIRDDELIPFKDAANELLDAIMATARLLDSSHQSDLYRRSVESQKAKVEDSSLTPSGQVMALVNDGQDFVDIAQRQAATFRSHFTALDVDSGFESQHKQFATDSLAKQVELEGADTQSFDEFLRAYNAS